MSMSAFRRSMMSFLTVMNFVAALRRIAGPWVGRLRGRRERLWRMRQIDVGREEVLDLGRHGLHPVVDFLRPFELRPSGVGIGFSFRVRGGKREFFDLGNAGFAGVDRVAVAGF